MLFGTLLCPKHCLVGNIMFKKQGAYREAHFLCTAIKF